MFYPVLTIFIGNQMKAVRTHTTHTFDDASFALKFESEFTTYFITTKEKQHADMTM